MRSQLSVRLRQNVPSATPIKPTSELTPVSSGWAGLRIRYLLGKVHPCMVPCSALCGEPHTRTTLLSYEGWDGQVPEFKGDIRQTVLHASTSSCTPRTWKVRGICKAYRSLQTEKPSFVSGRLLTRWPVAAKIALQIAGATGGKAGSPTPVGVKSLWMKCTSTLGAFGMRSIG
jgi:hypothetical protein